MNKNELEQLLDSIENLIDQVYEQREDDAKKAYSHLPEIKDKLLSIHHRNPTYFNADLWKRISNLSMRYIQLT